MNKTDAMEKLKWLECKSGAYNPQLIDPMTCIPFADINTGQSFVQFTLFNVNYDLFVRSEYRIELSVAGWVETEASYYHGRLMQRDSPDAAFVTFLNFIIVHLSSSIDTMQYLSSLRRGMDSFLCGLCWMGSCTVYLWCIFTMRYGKASSSMTS